MLPLKYRAMIEGTDMKVYGEEGVAAYLTAAFTRPRGFNAALHTLARVSGHCAGCAVGRHTMRGGRGIGALNSARSRKGAPIHSEPFADDAANQFKMVGNRPAFISREAGQRGTISCIDIPIGSGGGPERVHGASNGRRNLRNGFTEL